MKKYATTVTATQLLKDRNAEKGTQMFLGQPVKDVEGEVLAVIYPAGAAKVVKEGQWVAEYNDGTVEIFDNEVFEKDFIEVAEEKKEENPEEKEKVEEDK